MKFAYRFSNLLGTVYRCGNLNFTCDGNSVISPVGNRVTVFDLKNNKSDTLPLATRYNIKCVGLSPDGRLAIIVDEGGNALLASLVCRAVLHHFHFKGAVHSVSFSPDGRKFVITKGNLAQMYHAPGRKREFNAFVLDKTYFGPYDETTCIDWTDDSRNQSRVRPWMRTAISQHAVAQLSGQLGQEESWRASPSLAAGPDWPSCP